MADLCCRLNSRQERFVEHYALCGNAAEAARLAGYSAKTARVIGPENLSKPAVKAAIEARHAAFREELGVTKDNVVAALCDAIHMAREQGDPAAMISGLVQIARLCGFYETAICRLALTEPLNRQQASFSTMTDNELLEIARTR
jgi:phage terminase small subunit